MAGKKVTKYDLVESVYLQTKCDKKVVQSIVESLFEQIKESLKQSATIELRGFGTFELRLRKGKTSARNPKTGEHVSVEPHYVAAFRSGQELKNALWSLPEKKRKRLIWFLHVKKSNYRYIITISNYHFIFTITA